MCSATLSRSMYSYGCVAAVGVAVYVSCCVFLYSSAITITSAVITDRDTSRITNIVIMKMILRFVKRGSIVVTGGSRNME